MNVYTYVNGTKTLQQIKNFRSWLLYKPSGSKTRRIENFKRVVVWVYPHHLTIRLHFGTGANYANLEYKSRGAFSTYFLQWFARWSDFPIQFFSQQNDTECYEAARSLAITYGTAVNRHFKVKPLVSVNGVDLDWK